jgi:hypothetical protein
MDPAFRLLHYATAPKNLQNDGPLQGSAVRLELGTDGTGTNRVHRHPTESG